MSIIFLIHNIHLGGGGERVTIDLANGLVNNGYEVQILSLSPKEKTNIYTINPRIEVLYLDIDFESGSNFFKKISSIFKVRSFLSKLTQKTIVLGVGNYPSLLLCFLPKSKIIKTIGCQHLAFSGVKNVWATMRRLLFHRLDCIVSLTAQDVARFEKLNRNTVHIPNSFPLYPSTAALLINKRILIIGRMVPDKGYDLLLQVIEKFRLIQPDWEFRIVGDGPLHSEIDKEIRSKKLGRCVSMISSTKTILQEYLEASIYLMTSRTEGFPMVLLEAQACGLPIVSFDCQTGPAEIVKQGEDGYLIEPYDIDKMCQRLCELCNNLTLREYFGLRARQNVKRFAPEIIFEQWQSLLTQFK